MPIHGLEWIEGFGEDSGGEDSGGEDSDGEESGEGESGIVDSTQKLPAVTVTSTATCILVIEKEGIYTRLSEDRIFDSVPCILVTGKGYPDVATRAFVKSVR